MASARKLFKKESSLPTIESSLPTIESSSNESADCESMKNKMRVEEWNKIWPR